MSGPILGYVHGDDEYGLETAVRDLIAAGSADDDETTGPVVWRASGAETDIATILERVATGTLFGGGTIAVVTGPGPLVRSADGRAAMERAIAAVAPGNGLIILAPADRTPGRPSAGLDALRTAIAAAGGTVIEVRAPRADRFPGWIVDQARELGLEITSDAARELAERIGGLVREGDIDRSRMSRQAIAELDKLDLYGPGRRITVEDVRALVPEAVPGSMWAFLDALAERRPAPIAVTLEPLLATTPEPVVVAAVHRRLRDLVEVADRLAAGETVPSLVRSMRIKEYPARKMASQAARWTIDGLIDALDGLADIDAVIKGELATSEAQRRLGLTVWVRDRVVAG